jgi:hypothetical protein
MLARYDPLGEAMKALALVVALLSVPAFAGDHSPMARPRAGADRNRAAGAYRRRPPRPRPHGDIIIDKVTQALLLLLFACSAASIIVHLMT